MQDRYRSDTKQQENRKVEDGKEERGGAHESESGFNL